MEKLVVMDFMCQEIQVHIYNIPEDIPVDEDFIEGLGHDTSYCQWGFGTKVEVVYHKDEIYTRGE